jgi:putative protease
MKNELLVPAGDFNKLKTAVLYGADAVYAGVPELSLRTKVNFPLEELIEGFKYLNNIGKKGYLVFNLFTHNKDAEKLKGFFNVIKNANPDGVIIADPGIFFAVKKEFPNLDLHISTQANICSYLTVNFWKELNAALCVLSREASFLEIKEIREKCPDIKLEMFVHGAMCVSYSGRCLLSNFMAQRGANQGLCAHSCRWKYKVYLEEEMRKGEFFELFEDDKGSYILNSKDLCLMPRLNKILFIGLNSLKIEGRNKSEYYLGTAARAYRCAIDDWRKNPDAWNAEKYLPELYKTQSRGFTLGFFEGHLTDIAHNYDHTMTTGEYKFAGQVVDNDKNFITLKVKEKIKIGDEIEFLIPDSLENKKVKIEKMFNISDAEILEASAGIPNFCVKIAKNSAINDFNFPLLTLVRKKFVMPLEKQAVFEDNFDTFSKEINK